MAKVFTKSNVMAAIFTTIWIGLALNKGYRTVADSVDPYMLPFDFILTAGLFWVGVDFWRRKQWAFGVTVGVLVLILVLFPVGAFSPFSIELVEWRDLKWYIARNSAIYASLVFCFMVLKDVKSDWGFENWGFFNRTVFSKSDEKSAPK